MESRNTFRPKLAEIASKLDGERFERLKFLCKDLIPDGNREKIGTPELLFLELEQRKEITPNCLQFLITCLENVGRKDLADDLRNYERGGTEGKHFCRSACIRLVFLNFSFNCLVKKEDKLSKFLKRSARWNAQIYPLNCT